MIPGIVCTFTGRENFLFVPEFETTYSRLWQDLPDTPAGLLPGDQETVRAQQAISGRRQKTSVVQPKSSRFTYKETPGHQAIATLLL